MRGAFTGAVNARQGAFSSPTAHAASDEIGEMSPKLQVKLLRVRGRQLTVGSIRRRSRLRVIAATNHDLRVAVREGGFAKVYFIV